MIIEGTLLDCPFSFFFLGEYLWFSIFLHEIFLNPQGVSMNKNLRNMISNVTDSTDYMRIITVTAMRYTLCF